MSIKDRFKTNSKAEKEGVGIKFNNDKNSDGTVPVFFVRRMSNQNKAYMEAIRKLNDSLLDRFGVTSLDELKFEEEKQVDLETFVDTILVGWENFEPEDDGVKVPYNRENALAIFGDEDYHGFYKEIVNQSINRNNFSYKKVDAVAKN